MKPLAVASTVATFALVAIGGLVRATKSGLGCGDDWPRCSGKLIPALEQRAQIIEYSHRLAAGAVIILLAAMMVVALRYYRHDRRIVGTAVGGFGLVVGQAILGMIVVKLDLAAISVVLHLGTALALLALVIYVLVRVLGLEGSGGGERLSRRTSVAAASVFVLLLVGSYVSGTDAGYAFSDWPLMDGKVIPDLGAQTNAIHFLHRALAGVVAVIVLSTAMSFLRRKDETPLASRLACLAGALFIVEIVIGAANVWTRLNPAFVTAHLAVGAAIWGCLVATTFVTRSLPSPAKQTSVTKARPAVEPS